MKVIALGVNSAFATGDYEQGVTVQQAVELIMQFARLPNFKDIPRHTITREVGKLSQQFYAPRWHSNFLIEFDMPGKKGKPVHHRTEDTERLFRFSILADCHRYCFFRQDQEK